jgi:hypothetical protein
MVKGVLHFHSTYSDGEFTLAELRELFIAAGCRFGCITDHADWFDQTRLSAYRRECEQLSDERFRFIPGLEYTCVDRMHVLGYGVTALIASEDPEEVIRSIATLGGLAVVAHPKDTAFAAIERFDPLPDGIEVWNTKYDGRYAPRPATFQLLARVRARKPRVNAFYGQDLHWKRQYRGLFTVLESDRADRTGVLDTLRAGRYHAVKAGLQLPSNGVLAPPVLAAFERTQARSRLLRHWVKSTKRWVETLGVGVPAPLKAQLRRIF